MIKKKEPVEGKEALEEKKKNLSKEKKLLRKW